MWWILGLIGGGGYIWYKMRTTQSVDELAHRLWSDLYMIAPANCPPVPQTPIPEEVAAELVADVGGEMRSAGVFDVAYPDPYPMSPFSTATLILVLQRFIEFVETPSEARDRFIVWLNGSQGGGDVEMLTPPSGAIEQGWLGDGTEEEEWQAQPNQFQPPTSSSIRVVSRRPTGGKGILR